MDEEVKNEEDIDRVMLECKLNFPDGSWVKKLYPRALRESVHTSILLANKKVAPFCAVIEYEREYPDAKWEGALIVCSTDSGGETSVILNINGEIVERTMQGFEAFVLSQSGGSIN